MPNDRNGKPLEAGDYVMVPLMVDQADDKGFRVNVKAVIGRGGKVNPESVLRCNIGDKINLVKFWR